MVRTLIIEESLKDEFDTSISGVSNCSVLIGSVVEEKRFVLAIFHVPIVTDIESDFESSLQQLMYALPGGSYPIGIVTNEKVLSLLNIVKKAIQKLQKFVTIDPVLLEPFVAFKTNNKVDSKILIDGQLKPLSTKFQSFFSSWNQVCSYINIEQSLTIPKFENLRQWKTSFRTEICSLIQSLSSCKVHFSGSKCKSDKSYFEDPGKSKNSIGKVLHPKLIFPLTDSGPVSRTSVSSLVGSLYTHIFIPPKLTTEQTREVILEDIAKSLYCRAESFCEFAEQEIEAGGVTGFNEASLRLPYRVTFPLGLIELSVYLLQDERISQAAQVASELFDILPTNIKAHEECKELSRATCQETAEEEKDTQNLRNILLATLGGVVAVLVSVVFVSNTYYPLS